MEIENNTMLKLMEEAKSKAKSFARLTKEEIYKRSEQFSEQYVSENGFEDIEKEDCKLIYKDVFEETLRLELQ